jgi:hypothetical protein
LDDLETQLTRRANAKEGIVQLQSKLFLNEADGLGFFNGIESPAAWPVPVPPTALPELPASHR